MDPFVIIYKTNANGVNVKCFVTVKWLAYLVILVTLNALPKPLREGVMQRSSQHNNWSEWVTVVYICILAPLADRPAICGW